MNKTKRYWYSDTAYSLVPFFIGCHFHNLLIAISSPIFMRIICIYSIFLYYYCTPEKMIEEYLGQGVFLLSIMQNEV